MLTKKIEAHNKKRLMNLLRKIENRQSPVGWVLVTDTAVGGLTEVGFSQTSNFLLVVSSTGRGVFDCLTGEKVARDNQTNGDWIDEQKLLCAGIGPVTNEMIHVCGLIGGGLPHGNSYGERIEVVSPEWPISDLYFCSDYSSVFVEGHQSRCAKIDSDYLRTCGFSWCGHFLISATGSDFKLWRRL